MVVDYNFSDYIRIVLKRRNYFLIIVATAIVIATFLSLFLPPIYRSEMTMFAPTSIDVMSFVGRGGGGTQLHPLMPTLNEIFSGAALGLLKSKTMKDMVITKLNEEKPRGVKYSIDFSAEYGHFEVTVNDRSKERSAKIANIIPEAANTLIVEISEGSLENNIVYIKDQLVFGKIDLEATREELREFREENIHVVLGQQSSMIISKNVEYKVEYERLGVELENIRARINAVKAEMEREALLFVEEEAVAQDFVIQQLRNSLTQKEMQLASNKTQFTEFHPVIISLQKEIDDLRGLIQREVERLFLSETKPSSSFYENLRQNVVQQYVELTSIEAQREAFNYLIDESNQVLLTLPAIQNKLATLTFNETVKERVVESLTSRLTEMELQIGRQFQSFVVLESAEIPKTPSFPILWLNILLALLFGFGGGVIYCTFLEYIERAKIVKYADAETD